MIYLGQINPITVNPSELRVYYDFEGYNLTNTTLAYIYLYSYGSKISIALESVDYQEGFFSLDSREISAGSNVIYAKYFSPFQPFTVVVELWDPVLGIYGEFNAEASPMIPYEVSGTTLVLNKPIDLSTSPWWEGDLQWASSGEIQVTAGSRTATYGGTFEFTSSDVLGTLEYYYSTNLGSSDYWIFTESDIKLLYDLDTKEGWGSALNYIFKGDDFILGSDFDDTLRGFTGHDIVIGGFGNDLICSGYGIDILVGGIGNDTLDGGNGIDVAIYTGRINDYSGTINPTGTGLSSIIQDNRFTNINDGQDTLINVERLDFSDTNLALDIDGVAGQPYRIYKAAFDRVPDLPGLGYWINDMDKGASLEAVAGGFIASEEFLSRYGSNSRNVDFIRLLYENVLDRQPNANGYEYWQRDMANGMTREKMLINFNESNENKHNVAGLIENGIEYTPFIG